MSRGAPSRRSPRGGHRDRGQPGGAGLLRLAGWISAGMVLALALDRWLVPIAILTPDGNRQPLSPLYALWEPALGVWHLAAAAAALLLVGVAARLARRPAGRTAGRRGTAVALLAAALFALFATTLAMTRGGAPALTRPFVIYAGEDYTADLPFALRSPTLFLRHFVELMPRLSLHGSTHPPGFTLFLAGAVRLLGPTPMARALLVILAGALAMLPLHALARRRYGGQAARLAVLLYAVVPSALLFTATSLDALLPLPALAALDAADRARAGRAARAARAAAAARAAWAAAAGMLIALVTFLSFSGLVLLPLAAAVLLPGPAPAGDRSAAAAGPVVSAAARPLAAQYLWRGGALLAGFVLPYAALRLLAGFAIWDCLHVARLNLHAIEVLAKGRGLHPLRDAIYTTAGNLVAFAIGLGAPVTALAARAVARRDWLPQRGTGGGGGAAGGRAGDGDGLLAGLLVLLALMAGSTVYLLEVERIWLFLMAPWVAVAARELARHRAGPRLVAACVAWLAVQTLLMQTLLDTFW